MRIFAAPSPPATCPTWCATAHGPGNDVLEHASRAEMIAAFHREPPLTVAVAQTTYLLSSPLDMPAVVRVGEDELSPALARRMATALVAAADIAEGAAR